MVYTIGMPGRDGIDEPPLRRLAEDTGGGYYKLLDRDDLPRTFARIAEELRHQYVFGVTPSGDGSTHKLDVRVKRANAIARSRRVYWKRPRLQQSQRRQGPGTGCLDASDNPQCRVPSFLEALDRYERGDPAGRPFVRLGAGLLRRHSRICGRPLQPGSVQIHRNKPGAGSRSRPTRST